MRLFDHDVLPGRVVFGAGRALDAADEAERLGANRVLLIAGPSSRVTGDAIAARLGSRLAARIDEVVMHVPVERAEAAQVTARDTGAEGVIVVGGGSATGLAKAVALATGIPIVAVPTTYSGSEQTPIYGMTAGGRKRTGRDLAVLPRVVIYDPELIATLPAEVTAASGLNAMAHAVEALWAPGADPVVEIWAEGAIRALAGGLPRVVADLSDLEARGDTLFGAFMAGRALAVTGVGIHHQLCHVLGGAFSLPHADVHAVLLPHTTAFNREAAADALAVAARALAADDAAEGLVALARRLGVPTRLADLGLAESDLDMAARIVLESPPRNPRPIDLPGVRSLLDDAWRGRAPMRSATMAAR